MKPELQNALARVQREAELSRRLRQRRGGPGNKPVEPFIGPMPAISGEDYAEAMRPAKCYCCGHPSTAGDTGCRKCHRSFVG